MTPEEKQAYEWALNQKFPSVSARYARILAERIAALEAENERLKAALNINQNQLAQEQEQGNGNNQSSYR